MPLEMKKCAQRYDPGRSRRPEPYRYALRKVVGMLLMCPHAQLQGHAWFFCFHKDNFYKLLTWPGLSLNSSLYQCHELGWHWCHEYGTPCHKLCPPGWGSFSLGSSLGLNWAGFWWHSDKQAWILNSILVLILSGSRKDNLLWQWRKEILFSPTLLENVKPASKNGVNESRISKMEPGSHSFFLYFKNIFLLICLFFFYSYVHTIFGSFSPSPLPLP
jgi:hypothetical protein